MANSDRKKSEHLKDLEAAFEKRTRRFSPFEVLGLESKHKDDTEQDFELNEPIERKRMRYHPWVEIVHPSPDMTHPPMDIISPPRPGVHPPLGVPHPPG